MRGIFEATCGGGAGRGLTLLERAKAGETLAPLDRMIVAIAASAWVVGVAMGRLSDWMSLRKKLDDPNCQESHW